MKDVNRKKWRPKLNKTALFLAVLVVMVAVWAVLSFRQSQFGSGHVILGQDMQVEVDVASTSALRERGLSGRASLKEGEGMLFVFDKEDWYIFWMKDMNFPIDIIWISGGEIADITVDVPVPVSGEKLETYFPSVAVDAALEVPAGYSARHGLRVGMPVEHVIDRR